MALTPDRGELFIQEVDENYRRDQLRDFAKAYGKWIAVALVLFLGAVGGWLYWQDRQRQKVGEQTEQLTQVYKDISEGRLGTVAQRLEGLEKSGSDVMRASALFTRAAVALQQDDRKLAIAKYREVADDEGLPQPYRDLALVRLTALEFDGLQPQQVVARLQPLTRPGNPWFGSAGELTAMAYLKQGKRTEAGRLFAAIAADQQVPQSIRTRAVQIAGTLGIDASASLPLAAQ